MHLISALINDSKFTVLSISETISKHENVHSLKMINIPIFQPRQTLCACSHEGNISQSSVLQKLFFVFQCSNGKVQIISFKPQSVHFFYSEISSIIYNLGKAIRQLHDTVNMV